MKHVFSYAITYAAVIFGGGSLAGFMVFLISGSFQMADLGLGEPGILIFDTALSLLFFIQHSGMMRTTFQKRASILIPPEYYNAVYAIVSGVTLIFTLVLWQQSDVLVYSADGPLRWGIWFLFSAVVTGFMWGAAALGGFDPLGVKNIRNHLRGKPVRVNPFIIKGPYRLVRHPLYSCMILMMWLCPDLTADRLVFNVIWPVWIAVGAVLEERDLVDVFGVDYRRYQSKVPMLLPVRRPLNVKDSESSA